MAEKRIAKEENENAIHRARSKTSEEVTQAGKKEQAALITFQHQIGNRETQRLIADQRMISSSSSDRLNDEHALKLPVRADPALAWVQRQPGSTASNQASANPSSQKSLSRTLFIVQSDVWNKLPLAVRTSAEQELKRLFAFVGATSNEKPFSIRAVTPTQLPEQFDFSESVVSVIHGDTNAYVKNALTLQNTQIQKWLAQQKVQTQQRKSESKPQFNSEQMGSGSHNKEMITNAGKTYALLAMAGAVDIDGIIDDFLENNNSAFTDAMEKLPGKGKDISKWPLTLTSQRPKMSWQPHEMFGAALGRAIAHEARHEYIIAHSKEGLGRDAPLISGGTAKESEFSKQDQQAILNRIHELEQKQGQATVAPTFPQSIRKDPDQFPF